MDFDLPTQELQELSDRLDDRTVIPLRDRYDKPRRIKQPLSRYSSRVWLFPFGIHPSRKHPVEVFRNGLVQWMDHEIMLRPVGRKKPMTVVVFLQDTKEGDLVQATYIAVPLEET